MSYFINYSSIQLSSLLELFPDHSKLAKGLVKRNAQKILREYIYSLRFFSVLYKIVIVYMICDWESLILEDLYMLFLS